MRRFSTALVVTGSRFSLLALVLLTFATSLSNHAMAQSRFFTFERNTDRPGLDYSNTPSQGATECSFACQLENQCRAWTFVRPGGSGTLGPLVSKERRSTSPPRSVLRVRFPDRTPQSSLIGLT